MKSVIGILVFCCLLSAQAQTKEKTKKKPKGPQAVTIPGIPEKRPVARSKQKRWYYRWIIRDKLPSIMLEGFAKSLNADMAQVQAAFDREDAKKKPKKSVLKYYENLLAWYKGQQETIRFIKTKKTRIRSIRDSVQPADIATCKKLQGEITQKIREFKELINKKPKKPE